MAHTTSCVLQMAALLQAVCTTVLLFASMLVVRSAEAPSSPDFYQVEIIHVEDLSSDEPIRQAVPSAATNSDDGYSTAAPSTTDDDDTYMGTAGEISQGEYLMELEMGTKDKSFKAVFDTGSELIWTLCPNDSSSFAKKECPDDRFCKECDDHKVCPFKRTYGSTRMEAKGFMAEEMLTLSSRTGRKAVSITFGCAEECHDKEGKSGCPRLIPSSSHGIVGLNQGPRSLVSQLNVTRFSYCLSSRDHKSGSPLWFGGGDLSLRSGAVQTTPLVSNPEKPGSFMYYIELDGISIDGGGDARLVEIPQESFNLRSNDANGKRVMFVDSGCTYSKLDHAAFEVLEAQLAQKLNADLFLNKDNFTCFKHTSGADPEPDAVLHLNGAKMRLPWSNYMFKPDKETEHSCLAIRDSGKGMSILGNFQQQNIHMLYDREGNKLSFVPVDDCSKQHM